MASSDFWSAFQSLSPDDWKWGVASVLLGIALGLICAMGIMKCLTDRLFFRAAIWVGIPYTGVGSVYGLEKIDLISLIPIKSIPIFFIAYTIFIILPLVIQYKLELKNFINRSPLPYPTLDAAEFERETVEGNGNE